LPQHGLSHATQGSLYTGQLLKHSNAGFLFLQHPSDPAHLTLNAVQSGFGLLEFSVVDRQLESFHRHTPYTYRSGRSVQGKAEKKVHCDFFLLRRMTAGIPAK
jgi:hypothetical protein